MRCGTPRSRRGGSVRVWGEFCDDKLATYDPKPKDWFELWEDRIKGTHRFKFTADTNVASLKPLINREVHYWPLLQSDQFRADVFIREYEEFSRQDKVPDLMIMSLPCDHTEGTNPKYPTPRAMMADNDLALGRVVEAVSKSPQWKETCIFVVEDDAQSGPDHVDGHRTVFMAISPYNRRGDRRLDVLHHDEHDPLDRDDAGPRPDEQVRLGRRPDGRVLQRPSST